MLVLTGDIGCGKTTWCAAFARQHPLQGFLSLKTFVDDEETGIRLRLLPTGEELFMASTAPFAGGEQTGRFWFAPETFQRVNRLPLSPDRPFLFDEFGRLEMKARGHWGLFGRLLESELPLLVVVRRNLLDEFVDRFAPEVVADFQALSTAELEQLVRGYLSFEGDRAVLQNIFPDV